MSLLWMDIESLAAYSKGIALTSLIEKHPIQIMAHLIILSAVLLLSFGCVAFDKVLVPSDSITTASSPSNVSATSHSDNLSSTGASVNKTQVANGAESLSEEVHQRLIEAIANDTSQPQETLRIESATPKTWSNGCLGLAKPDEFCTMSLVEGWQIEIKIGDSLAIYRSNADGRAVRRAN